MAEAHSPLEQFQVHRLVDMRIGDFDVSFTNASAMMVAVVIAATALLTISMRGPGHGTRALGNRSPSSLMDLSRAR